MSKMTLMSNNTMPIPANMKTSLANLQINQSSAELGAAQRINPIAARDQLFGLTDPVLAEMSGSFLPQISSSRKREVVTGKGIDDLYTKNNESLLRHVDDNKNLNTEINQLKKVNEKLNDRVDFLQSIIEKEASANTFYYNYPPKADDTLKVNTKDKKSDNEGQKIKKMYEDQME